MLWSLAGAAFAAVAVVVSTAAVVVLQREETARSRERIAELQTEAERAGADIANANKKIAEARAQAARLEMETEVARGQIADATKAAAVANERAASLESEAATARNEQERLRATNLALQQQIQPRLITDPLANRIVSIARKHPNAAIAIASYALDTESAVLGEQLVRLFRADNIPFEDRRMSLSAMGGIVLGIRVTGTDAEFAREIRDAFRAAGFLVGDQPPPPATGISMGNPNSPAPVNLFLGVKPI